MNLTKTLNCDKLLQKAEEQNPELWNSMYSIVNNGPDLELDQFAKCGQTKCSLYQVGEGNIQTKGFNFHGHLN